MHGHGLLAHHLAPEPAGVTVWGGRHSGCGEEAIAAPSHRLLPSRPQPRRPEPSRHARPSSDMPHSDAPHTACKCHMLPAVTATTDVMLPSPCPYRQQQKQSTQLQMPVQPHQCLANSTWTRSTGTPLVSGMKKMMKIVIGTLNLPQVGRSRGESRGGTVDPWWIPPEVAVARPLVSRYATACPLCQHRPLPW